MYCWKLSKLEDIDTLTCVITCWLRIIWSVKYHILFFVIDNRWIPDRCVSDSTCQLGDIVYCVHSKGCNAVQYLVVSTFIHMDFSHITMNLIRGCWYRTTECCDCVTAVINMTMCRVLLALIIAFSFAYNRTSYRALAYFDSDASRQYSIFNYIFSWFRCTA